jgi:opacity protein-like surface antigen
MNKFTKHLIISAAILSSSVSSASMLMPESTATDYNYAGIKAGGVFPNNIQGNTDLQNSSGDNSYTAGLFIGRKIRDRFTVELEYMNRGESDINSSSSVTNASDSWAVKADTFMLNMLVDIMTDTLARPYFKVGVGASRNKSNPYVNINSTTSTQTWGGKTVTEFAWQVGFGVDMPVNKAISAMLEYSYVDHGQFKTENGYTQVDGGGEVYVSGSAQTGKLRDQVLTAGLKFKF